MANPYESPQALSFKTEPSSAPKPRPKTRWRGLLILVLVLVGLTGVAFCLDYVRLLFALPQS